MQQTIHHYSVIRPWWNRPLWGNQSILERILNHFQTKPAVPEGVLALHNRELAAATELAKQAEKLDCPEFASKEFVQLLKIRRQVRIQFKDSAPMGTSAQFLKAAIEAKDCFETIWQVEFQYFARKQQQYYTFIESLLNQNLSSQQFVDLAKEKLEITLPEITRDEGRVALNAYYNAINKLSTNKLGLELLGLFKRYQLSDFLLMRTVSLIVEALQKQDLTESRVVMPAVMKDYALFEKLIPIMKCPPTMASPEFFARIVQLVALEFKHQKTLVQFSRLASMLEEWRTPYREILTLREKHGAGEYKQPQEFAKTVPGLSLYTKYEEWLEE
uniref:Uncharacterized protein n=1 Tax=Cyanothece sp. (strain PCC 7425 / ATCC 29141) TaxID=395961 RepID=B8HLT4_CYAP4